MSSPAPPPVPAHHLVADAGTAPRMARADASLRTSGMLLSGALMTVNFALMGLGAALTRSPFLAVLAVLFLLLAVGSLLPLVAVRAAVRRSAAELYPVGAAFTAEYGPVLRLVSPGRETVIPYPTILAVRGNRDGVLLALGTQPSYTIPAELCPPAARAAVQSARLSPPPALQPAALPYRFEPDAAFLHAVGARMRVRTLREPAMWVAAVTLLLGCVALLVAFPGWWWLALGGIVLTSGLVAVLTETIVIGRIRRSYRGHTLLARFDDAGFALLDRGIYTWRRYDTLRDVVVAGAVIECRTAASADPEFLPTALFPVEVRERIAASAAALS